MSDADDVGDSNRIPSNVLDSCLDGLGRLSRGLQMERKPRGSSKIGDHNRVNFSRRVLLYAQEHIAYANMFATEWGTLIPDYWEQCSQKIPWETLGYKPIPYHDDVLDYV